MALALVDFWSRHITVVLPALVTKMEEEMYHATHRVNRIIHLELGVASGDYFCIGLSKAMARVP